MSYLYNLFISIDQLGNTLAGGNPDNSISGRVGFFSNHYPNPAGKKYWKVMQKIIDTTFWPVDGKDHCHRAYHTNAGHDYPDTVNLLLLFLLSFLAGVSCLVLFVPFWLFWIVRAFIGFKDK